MNILRSLLLSTTALVAVATSTQGAVLRAQSGVFYTVLDSDDGGTGQGGGAIFRSQLVGILGADARVGYVNFGDSDVSMVPLEASLILRAPIPFFAVYGGLGGGIYFLDGKGVDYDNATGYYPLVGAEFKISELVLFAEARYLFLEAETSGSLTSRTDSFDGPGFNVGLSFRF